MLTTLFTSHVSLGGLDRKSYSSLLIWSLSQLWNERCLENDNVFTIGVQRKVTGKVKGSRQLSREMIIQ